MKVFFYGLFMDANLLATRGIEPGEIHTGFVDDYDLRIGERATLVPCPGSRAYGLVMDIASEEARKLYADESVADYEPEVVFVELSDGQQIEATCYNLPVDKITGTNSDYAASLLQLAIRLKFPAEYLERIRQPRRQAERR